MLQTAPSPGAALSPGVGPATAPDATVSVLVPARNEQDTIRACLDSILAQEERSLEVLVVDGESEDSTVEIVRFYARRDPRVVLVRSVGGSIPASLNAGLRAARGRWLVRVDAHSTVPPDYVGRLVAHLETGTWAGVGGRKDGVGATPTGAAIAAALGSPFGVGNSIYHHGTSQREVDHVPFGAYPVALLRELGGWDERLKANEDFELDHRIGRAGHRLLFDPAIRVDWGSRQTIGEFFGQYRRYGRGKADVVWLHPRSLHPRHLAAPSLVGGLVASPALALVHPVAALVVPALYGAAVALATLVTGRRLRDGRARRRLPGAFAAMHVGWGIGFWEGLARGAFRRGGRGAR